MSAKNREKVQALARQRIATIQDQIRGIELLCSGTLQRRMKVCGRPTCRCARDPKARHGPYYEWGRMKGGKLVNRMVSPEEARRIRKGIANYRAVRRLLRAWEEQTVRLLETEKRRK
jgi:hypothetical protein